MHVGLVDLHDVGAGGEEITNFLVDGGGVIHRRGVLARIVVVLGLLAHREGAWHGHLDRPGGVGAQEPYVLHFDRAPAPDRAHDARHRIGMARAVERGARIVDVDALERRGEPVRIALAADLAVGDRVDAGQLHLADGDEGGVVLRLEQVRLGNPPGVARAHAGNRVRAESFAVDQPLGLRVAPDDGAGQRVGWTRTHAPRR